MKWKFFCLISIVLLVEANNRLKYIRNLQWRINGFHSRLFAPTWLFQKEGFIENVLCNFIQSLFHFNQVSTLHWNSENVRKISGFKRFERNALTNLVNVVIAAGPYLFHNENEKCNKLRNAFGGRVRGLGR